MIAVYAKCHVQADKVATFCEIANRLVAYSRQDVGCVSYQVGEIVGDTHGFAFVELWQSQADLDLHLTQPHFEQAMSDFEDVLDDELHIELVEIL